MPSILVADILEPYQPSPSKPQVWCEEATTLSYTVVEVPVLEQAGQLVVKNNPQHIAAIEEAAWEVMAYADGLAAYLNAAARRKGEKTAQMLDGYGLAYKAWQDHLIIGVQY